MIKKLLTLTLIATLSTVSAHAETMKVPSDDAAVASITFPDSWEQNEIDNGVSAQSSDSAVFMSIVSIESEKGMDAEIDDTFAMLKEHKVELDQSSKKENKFKIGEYDAEEMLFQGKDQDGPTAVSITFVTVKDKVLVITYWVSTEDEAEHSDEITAIVKSIKAI
ncbi:MAG: DcrB-related protein [Chthoniobacterales bacterium]